jgi:hypothetical protein
MLCSDMSSILEMESAGSSETLTSKYQTTRHQTPEEHRIHWLFNDGDYIALDD